MRAARRYLRNNAGTIVVTGLMAGAFIFFALLAQHERRTVTVSVDLPTCVEPGQGQQKERA